MASFPILGCLIVAPLALWWFANRGRNDKINPLGLPLPPGPKPYPIIQNLLDVPLHKSWLVYSEWFKIYGDMVYLRVLGRDILVLRDLKTTNDLLEKRSHNYSDRPPLPMLNDHMGWNFAVASMHYGSLWRRHRRLLHDHFNAGVIKKYRPVQISVARILIRNLLESPSEDSDFSDQIRFTFAAIMMKITYGITVKDKDDEYISCAEEALKGLGEAATPGRFLVDIFPIMKWIPSWIPGAGWKRKAEYWAIINTKIINEPFEWVKKQINEGCAVPSICSRLIEELPEEGSLEEEKIVRDVCAITYLGGADTTVSVILSFFLAMCLHPEVQKKAQAELDSVLHGRLPEFTDYPFLPYIQAIAKETLRWNPVAPIAFGHVASEADEYNGYYIPKGTFVLGSGNHARSLSLPKSKLLHPERYLNNNNNNKIDPTIRDPSIAVFGYGRRICPGRFFVHESLFIVIVHILAVFDIKPGVDEDGNEVEVKPNYVTTGVLQYPAPFSCRIIPRSTQAEELIRNSDSVG
ncbi:hypothetical protein AGABI1DRAFT_130252 [Agaricus bisporus var. burnettii JB137-S8]|uniref:Cytochrome P450 n=1 Tax=Agaricus bisporus var. burnettii (strain JB137-S8 / ATCC MYA-4627 / FGSC 10392) TaxID=597362 RepID=K5X3Q8_AGABU|nr:uncharacterized protein AGABI1DRAFT_130252 [Agaricus bisporus var. burnettii JB137-S8]EKM77557.1 hypothetical protein AGABI1DRAFT_130252 [Agaricus bisporus var. burnettii JB137-S8]